MKIRKLISTIFITTFTLLSIIPLATANSFNVSGIDTIAGYAALLKVEETVPNQSITLTVEKPNGSKINIEGKTNNEGISKIDLYDFHTKQAGIYKVWGKFKNETNNNLNSYNSFKVYPDKTSNKKSDLSAHKVTATANNLDKTTVIVSLKDQHGNPIPNHIVKLISSRSEDLIIGNSEKQFTNQKGEINFIVSSPLKGVSVYTALDVSSETTIKNRLKIAYLKAVKSTPLNIGGNYLQTSVLLASETAGAIHHFKIEEIASTVKVGETLNFTITAYDQKEVRVTNYLGKIRFAVTDPNAKIPKDYQFTSDDLGIHKFNLSLTFNTPGKHIISVGDTLSYDLKGELELNVISLQESRIDPQEKMPTQPTSSNLSTNLSNNSQKPIITNPKAGTYSNSKITIDGKSNPDQKIKIFNNNQEIGSTLANNQGTFSFSTSNLPDGNHTIYVAAVTGNNEVVGVSGKTVIKIDSSSAKIESVKVTPSIVGAGETAEIKVYSEKELSQVAIIFDNRIIEMQESLTEPGTYKTSLRAPLTAGKYRIDIVTTDKLGNEGEYSDKVVLNVQNVAAGQTLNNQEETLIEKKEKPNKINNTSATPSDSKVTLNWQAPSSKEEIKNYKIYYGIDKNKLIASALTFDQKNTWYIPKLINGTPYYFAVSALDKKGNEGEKSETVMSIPFESKTENSSSESLIGEIKAAPQKEEEKVEIKSGFLEDNKSEIKYQAPQTPDSGPGITFLILSTLGFGSFYTILKKKKLIVQKAKAKFNFKN